MVPLDLRHSRRWMLAAAGAAALPRSAVAAEADGPRVTPLAALLRLMGGNGRYVAGRPTHPDQDAKWRTTLATTQHPFATVLGCADSRVAPEVIFDQGLGDIFDVRVAGNVVDDAVLASIEYAVVHLSCPLIMVLGHERCGAVTAAVEAAEGKGSAEDRETKIGELAALIAPAVNAAPPGPNRVEAAILINARRSADVLVERSAVIRERTKENRVHVVSARYDLDSGKVTDVKPAAQ